MDSISSSNGIEWTAASGRHCWGAVTPLCGVIVMMVPLVIKDNSVHR